MRTATQSGQQLVTRWLTERAVYAAAATLQLIRRPLLPRLSRNGVRPPHRPQKLAHLSAEIPVYSNKLVRRIAALPHVLLLFDGPRKALRDVVAMVRRMRAGFRPKFQKGFAILSQVETLSVKLISKN